MPIAKWKCPHCQQVVDLDHFENTTCGLYLPADYAQSVLDHQEEQFPDGGTVRVSSASGCPRAAAIMTTEDVAVDPLAFNAMHTGTGWHLLMSSIGEFGIVREVEVEGTIDGIQMRGHIDRLLRVDGTLYICDWKHQKDGNRRYQTEPKPEHIVQTSLYAQLYAQTIGEFVTKSVI
jgi:PD-(D/E)XK nuclease superfamily protein